MNALQRAQERLQRNDYQTSTESIPSGHIWYRFAALRMAKLKRDGIPWLHAEVSLPILFIAATIVLAVLVNSAVSQNDARAEETTPSPPIQEELTTAGMVTFFLEPPWSDAIANGSADVLLFSAFLIMVVALELEELDNFFQPLLAERQRSLLITANGGHPWMLWWKAILFLVGYLIVVVMIETGLLPDAVKSGLFFAGAIAGGLAFWQAKRHRDNIRVNLEKLANL